MSSQDEATLELPITIVDDEELNANLSGSHEKPNKQENIIIPIEEYHGAMTEDEVRQMKQQQIGDFPDLFHIRGCPDDKDSETESLKLSKPTQLFATLLETQVRQRRKGNGGKVQH